MKRYEQWAIWQPLLGEGDWKGLACQPRQPQSPDQREWRLVAVVKVDVNSAIFYWERELGEDEP